LGSPTGLLPLLLVHLPCTPRCFGSSDAKNLGH